MDFQNYLFGLKKNISTVNKAVKGGSSLTRLERFDYLFKKELIILKGMRSKRTLLNRLVNNASNSDYRLACFYAMGFSGIMDTIENGYSVEGLRKQYTTIVKSARYNYICSKTFKVNISDRNGKIHVELTSDCFKKQEFEICSLKDYVSFSIYLVSLLGSLDEASSGFRKWFESYLAREFIKIEKGVSPKPFVEKDKVDKSFESSIIENDSAIDNKKVIYLNKPIIQ